MSLSVCYLPPGAARGAYNFSWEGRIFGHEVRVAKFDPKFGSRRTTKIENMVVIVIILVALILLFNDVCMSY